jgi:hypothetical protein
LWNVTRSTRPASWSIDRSGAGGLAGDMAGDEALMR